MNSQTRALLTGVNAGIIKIRGAYAAWCRQNGVNYHEMLILYSLYIDDIRTQKAISQAYGVPKQTINNLIRALQEKGYLTLAPNASNRQERILTLTEPGLRYAESILLPLLALEESAICAMGAEAVRQMVDMALRYGAILEKAMREASEEFPPFRHLSHSTTALRFPPCCQGL